MLPALYVSHGSPTLLLYPDSLLHGHLSDIGEQNWTPRAILVMSAHWQSSDLRVTARPDQEIIYDFRGFPEELYQKQYPAPGDEQLAKRVAELTGATLDYERGLDHGAWVPLYLMYPKADIPVVQISLPFRAEPQDIIKVGESLSELRKDGVLIIGSGAMTHNLFRMERFSKEEDAQSLAAENWLVDTIEAQDFASLRAATDQMPAYSEVHPTDDHWFPFYIALGAAREKVQVLYRGLEHKTVSMLAAQFD